jgi:2-polyprenyl-3-methyl-5-hydroxy-6-metoxy-1,4-benzoquinol methylase
MLTRKEYWDATYTHERVPVVELNDWRTYCNTQIYARLEPVLRVSRAVLEVGAGDSSWLPRLAEMYPAASFTGLDYSEAGCRRLSARLESCGVKASVRLADMFHPPADMQIAFDLALSFGVVEHFSELDRALRAKASFVRPGGAIFTLIPNMAGIYGALTRRWNRAVYDIHVPHDLDSFLAGHAKAGLSILDSGYIGSSNFGILASCFDRSEGARYRLFVQMTRISKLAWWSEMKGLPLPTSRWLSPYLFAVARV